MDLMLQKALFGGIIPAAAAALLVSLALWRQVRGHACRRLAAWAVPLAMIAGLIFSYVGQFGALQGRWRWILLAGPVVLLAWCCLLMPWPTRLPKVVLWSIAGGLAIGLIALGLAWPAFYDESLRLPLLLAAGAAVLCALLYPIAVRNAGPADALAVAGAAGLLAPAIIISGNGSLGELLLAMTFACGVGGLLALVPGQRYDEWRLGTAAGAIGLGAVLPIFAVITWINSHDRQPTLPAALILPCLAVPLVWIARLPWLSRRPIVASAVALVAVLAVAAVGLARLRAQTDVDVYEMPF